MSSGTPDLLVSAAQFAKTLERASQLDEHTLREQADAGLARSYFVRFDGRLFSLKAVTRLAYLDAGITYNGPQSALVARRLRSQFDIIHLTRATEKQRLDRQRELAERWARPGQAKFREKLLELYGARCAVSGCSLLDAIDAAHVQGVDGAGEDVVSNGVILRADLHRLFDRDLMAVDPTNGVICFDVDCGDHYAEFNGQRVFLPDGGPKLHQFQTRWSRFRAQRDR